MKAVVVELKNNEAIVLSDDGCVVKLKNNNYELGQIIQVEELKIKLTKKIAIFATSAAAAFLLGVSTWAYASPYSYVSVDVNPSIEFSINRFDRVIKVKAINDDGEEILQELTLDKLTNRSITTAITKTVEQISAAGYFENEVDDGIVIATSSENLNKADHLAQELQEAVIEEVSQTGSEVVVETFSVGLERVEEAKELGVTPGKLNLVEKLQEAAVDTDIKVEEWVNKPVKEIIKATNEYKDNANISMANARGKDPILQENNTQITENSDEQVTEQDETSLSKAEKAAIKADKEAKIAKEKAEAAKKKADEKTKIAEEKTNALTKENHKGNKKDVQDANTESKEDQKEVREAQKEAKNAQKEAREAQKKADKAIDKANKAQEKADKAIDKPNKAQEKADKENKKEKQEDKAGKKTNIDEDQDSKNTWEKSNDKKNKNSDH